MPNANTYQYSWPAEPLNKLPHWSAVKGAAAWERRMPESKEDLAQDSRWPAFFPSPISIVTVTDGMRTCVEKVVGATIVNRFPYVIAVSVCKEPLSSRHYVRDQFMEILEAGGSAAVQFFPLGQALDTVMQVIAQVPDDRCHERLSATGLPVRQAGTNEAPVFGDAYLVYEAKLVRPSKDFGGTAIYAAPYVDSGSHRMYFLEITAIQLRQDIAEGRTQIHWRSLPEWTPGTISGLESQDERSRAGGKYTKGYTPHYVFPSAGTIAFEADSVAHGMSIKLLPPLPEDQVEVDNDRARWPCFFPSSAGLITTWTEDGMPNLMPCGSTSVVSRHPMVIAPCVSYADINIRYASRASLGLIRKTGKFGCGVPYISDQIVQAIKYAGNISIVSDRDKVAHAGLAVRANPWAPVLTDVPIHFDCEVVGEVRLGTHIMFLGEVRRIEVREDVNPQNPLRWLPWADVREVSADAQGKDPLEVAGAVPALR